MKITLQLFLLLFFAVFFTACNSEEIVHPTKEELIEARINGQLANWKSALQKKCERKVMEAAEAIVDSTLIAEARLNKDTSLKPGKPVKPEVPAVLELKDTVPVKPILE